jgi:adenosylcobinamide-GDP ribazoletransferase
MTKPARPGGLGALTKDARPSRCLGGILAALLLWIALIAGIAGALSSLVSSRFALPFAEGPLPDLLLLFLPPAAGLLNALFFARLYGRALGGYTGDALGAAVETGELLHLLIGLAILKAWGFSI